MTELTRGEKLRQTMLKKHGSLEAWKKAMQEQGRKGGKSPKTKPAGFAANPELAREAAYKGLAKRWGHGDKKQSV